MVRLYLVKNQHRKNDQNEGFIQLRVSFKPSLIQGNTVMLK